MSVNPVLTIAFPLILAFTKIMYRKVANYFLVAGTLLNVFLVFLMKEGQYLMGGYGPPFGIVLRVDAYALYSMIVLNVLFAALMILVTKKAENLTSSSLIALAALNGLIMTGDLFNLFVFLEIATIAAFIIASSNKRYHYAFHYMVAAIIGSTFYLLGLILLYNQYGTLNMAKMKALMDVSQGSSGVALLLIFVGLAVEVKLLPFAGWAKGVLNNADEWIGPLIGAIYGGVMLIVLGRLFTDVFVLTPRMTLLFSLIALFTLIGGEAAAYDSESIRGLLLYSSIAQAGMATLLILNGYAALSFVLILSTMVSKYVMFLIAGYIVEAKGEDKIQGLGGLFRDNPLHGLTFTVAGMSIIGMPLFLGFFVKLNILYNLMANHGYVLPALVLVAALVEGIYMLRMLLNLWRPEREASGPKTYLLKDHPRRKWIVHGITLGLSLVLVVSGLFPDQIFDLARKARAGVFTHRPIHTVQMRGGLEQ